MAVSVPRLLAVGVALFAHLIVPFLEILAYNPNGVPDPSVFLNVCEDLTNVTPQHSSNGTLPQQRQKACTIKTHLGVPACTGRTHAQDISNLRSVQHEKRFFLVLAPYVLEVIY